MTDKEIFARNLNKYMMIEGKSRKDLSDDLNISYYTITDWVKGKKMPRMDKITLLAEYFGVNKSDLIEENIGKEPPADKEALDIARAKLLASVKDMSDEQIYKLIGIIDMIQDK